MPKVKESEQARLARMTQYERRHWQHGEIYVAGIDEAGRGPLAGPVVAACVIMPQGDLITGVNDSKLVSEKKRESLYDAIIGRAICFSVFRVDEDEIDRINILNAAKKAFLGALNGLTVRPHHVYTDAVDIETDLPLTPVIKGDQKLYTIAAASIIAKVTRDRIMREYDELYPGYEFAQHKGYGTEAHYDALRARGACKIHRKTFLKKFFGEK